MKVNLNVRISLLKALFRGFQLRPANVALPVQNLPVKVGLVHVVKIHQTNPPDARGGQIQRHR